MTDPTYTYIKGMGWVIEPSNLLMLVCGTRVTWERRPPRTGERYRRAAKSGPPIPANAYICETFSSFSTARQNDSYYEESAERYHYVVFTRVD